MIFILGIILGNIAGMVEAILLLLGVMYFHPVIERKLHQTQAKLKPKGAIIEPQYEEVSQWIDSMKAES